MKTGINFRVYFIGLISLCCNFINAQNVGIGTNTPQANLEIKKPIRSKLQISSANYTDSSTLVFSNRNNLNQGTDFVISSNQEQGLRVSSQSDLAQNTNATILNITPAGNMGIGQAVPAERLDVNGNINVSGSIRANGVAGQAGQVLVTSSSGNLAWGNASAFTNFQSFNSPGGGQTWVVPAGVTKILVEVWGAGGAGSGYVAPANGFGEAFGNGGGGGGYITAVANVTPGSTIFISVGAGGIQNGAAGGSSTVLIGATTIQAYAGDNAVTDVTGVFSGAAGGSFNITSPGTVIVGYDGQYGEYGSMADKLKIQDGASPVYLIHWGDGGSAGNTSNTGGKGGTDNTYAETIYSLLKKADRPGGGGPGGNGSGGTHFNGAAGKVMIRW